MWRGTGSARRLTAHGRQVLAGMVTAALPLAEMAARFGMRSDSMIFLMPPGMQVTSGNQHTPSNPLAREDPSP